MLLVRLVRNKSHTNGARAIAEVYKERAVGRLKEPAKAFRQTNKSEHGFPEALRGEDLEPRLINSRGLADDHSLKEKSGAADRSSGPGSRGKIEKWGRHGPAMRSTCRPLF